METQLINIDGKDYFLKFGYGAFRVLGKIWKVETLEATGEKISKAFKNIDKKNGGFGFEQLDVLSDMIFSAIICKNPEVENILNRDDIATEILKKPQELTLVIELYMSSISTMLSPEGKKPQPPETKRLQIKK